MNERLMYGSLIGNHHYRMLRLTPAPLALHLYHCCLAD